MATKIKPSGDEKIFKVKEDGTIVRTDEVSSTLNKEILDIIEINSYSKKILAAYKARKIANKISKKEYGKQNYKEYVEMLMVKHFPKELEKSIIGKRYVMCRNSMFFIVPPFFVYPVIWLIKYRKQLKELYKSTK